jgi:polysaccharide biosynthesis protein PslH
MRILVFYPYIPYPTDRGTYQRTFHLLRALAAEHTVDLIALSENGERMEHAPVFEAFCDRVKFVPFQHPAWSKLSTRLFDLMPASVQHWTQPEIARALDEMIESGSYDFIHVCDIVLAQYLLDKHRDLPMSMDRSRVDLQFQLTQQAVMTRGFKAKLLGWECIAKMWAYEKRIAKRVSVEIVCGPDDEVFIRKHVSKTMPVKVLANGVDLEYFHPDSAPDPRAAEPTVLFCGAMDYTPNVDALRWFFAEIHPRLLQLVPELRVLIVGKSPIAEVQAYGALQGVTVTGGVPDVRPYYRRSWLQIVPLRIGGGTRLKIVESMAIGTPVVSTTIGAQGLDLVHDHDILLADDPESFASQTARALLDATLRSQTEERGMSTAVTRLAWPMLGKNLSEFYRNHFRQKAPIQPRNTSHEPQPESRVGAADLHPRRAL